MFQEYSEWKNEIADACLPTVHINRMDHLTTYVQVVTDATQELCDLILSTYREKNDLKCHKYSGECHFVYFPFFGSQLRKYCNISTAHRQIAIEFYTGIYGPKIMNPDDFSDLLTFPLAPPAAQALPSS